VRVLTELTLRKKRSTVGSCEHGTEIPVTIEGEEFL